MIANAYDMRSFAASGHIQNGHDETITKNDRWHEVGHKFSIVVPAYHDDASVLIETLGACIGSERTEIVVYDDGSLDTDITNRITEAIMAYPGAACLITCSNNKGRSAARNRLQALSRASWLLMLDADMVPDSEYFLQRYARKIKELSGPGVIVGGFSLELVEPSARTRLHWEQSATSECLPASVRNIEPGRYVFTSNVLVHRDVMNVVPFDPMFVGWGWEDVDWGLRVARRFPVRHIDNTATHLGLDDDRTLIGKYERSGSNFALAVRNHPEALGATPLFRLANTLRMLPGKPVFSGLFKGIARMPGFLMPLKARLFALKFFRAFVYAEALNEN